MTDAKAWERHWTKQIEERDATIKELVEALGAFTDFDDLPLAAQRPDVFELILQRARRTLAKYGGKP